MKALILLTSFFTISAMAATNNSDNRAQSEFFHRPGSGLSEFEAKYVSGPTGKRSVTAATAGSTAVDVKYSGYFIDASYMYGVSDDMAFGAEVNSGDLKIESGTANAKNTGASDPVLKFMGASDSLQYGADLTLGMTKRKDPVLSTTAPVDGNRNVGGMVLRPYIGLLAGDGDINYGGMLDYTYFAERKIDATSDPTITGGNALGLTGMLEYNYGSGWFGASYKLVTVADTQRKTGSTSTTLKGDLPSILNFYFTYDVGACLLTAAYEMDMYKANDDTSNSGTNNSAYTATNISLGVRFYF